MSRWNEEIGMQKLLKQQILANVLDLLLHKMGAHELIADSKAYLILCFAQALHGVMSMTLAVSSIFDSL